MLSPRVGLVDSKYEPERVFKMCVNSWKGAIQYWPTQGSDATYGTYTEHEVRTHPGLKRYQFVDHTLKNELYDRRIKQLDGPRIFLPGDTDQKLIGQLSGQQRVTDRGMHRTTRWKRVTWDHLGDCLKQVVLYQYMMRTAKEAQEQREAEMRRQGFNPSTR
jgi:hypothetical protein